jgi:hypothetical protein
MPTDFRYIPGGICSSRKFHEPAPVPTMEPPILMRPRDEHNTSRTPPIPMRPRDEHSTSRMPPGSFDPTYANRHQPKDDRLVADVVAILIQNIDRPLEEAVRTVLRHPRIALGLKLIADVDAGAVELISYGSKQESSDAR